ncbi:transmembrane protein 182-like [Scleropages formosus]|uniref:Transmembrane protein 182-like n=1 Tax=Scleropages formosus TaxID=113540 RepID=A0A0N8JXC9_SCLFO|nr:transmembrane protein 182-like [Scleropages formosus]
MKAGVAALLAGVVGAIGVLCFLVAFGTDYWLLASDDCEGYEHLPRAVNSSLVGLANGSESEGVTWPSSSPSLTLHHEGFFWRCAFKGEASIHVVWAVLFTNQPAPKVCIRGYLFPLPVAVGPVPHPAYDATAVFRGFWTMLIVLAIGASLMGGFLLVCAVPFTSAKLYRWAGIFLLTAASLFLALVILFVLWKELVADVRRYVLQERGEHCPNVHMEAHYGWSFIVAAAGMPLVFFSGLLFYFIALHIQRYK